MPRPILLYDADCGFCLRAVAWAPRLRLRTAVAALQDVDLDVLGVDASRAERELPFVAADGGVAYGHRAVAGALRTGRGLPALVGRLVGARLLDGAFAGVYAWVSQHRHALPGGTPTCALPPQPSEGRRGAR